MKKLIIALMIGAFCFGLMGCGNKEELAAKDKEIADLKAKVEAVEKEKAELTTQLEEVKKQLEEATKPKPTKKRRKRR